MRSFLRVALLLLACLPGLAGAEVTVPALKARVTDLTGTLSPQQRDALETRLAQLEAAKGSQLAVLLVPPTQPEASERYPIRVVEAWKLGRKGVDDGVLLLVAKDDRALRIEVGYGLEGVIPDAVAKRVIEEVIVPRFKEGDMPGGIEAGVDTLIRLIEGEPLPAPAEAPASSSPSDNVGDWVGIAFVVTLIGGGILRALLGPLLAGIVSAGIALVAGWFLFGSIISGIVIGVVVFFTVLAGLSGSGGGGRGGFSSGGGGGFSGGGGSFGGGGASGRW